jgi:hypothetical protein
MDKDPIKTAGREKRRQERLCSSPRVCPFCGCVDPIALIAVAPEWLLAKGVPRTLFEGHHSVGEAHDPELIVLICRNCHAKATERLLCAGVSMRPAPDPVTRVALILDALAEFFEMLVAALRRWAETLRKSTRPEVTHD